MYSPRSSNSPCSLVCGLHIAESGGRRALDIAVGQRTKTSRPTETNGSATRDPGFGWSGTKTYIKISAAIGRPYDNSTGAFLCEAMVDGTS